MKTIDTSIYDARQAEAERERLRRVERARRKRALGAPPDGQHGASAYTNYGCHCTICRTAWREKRRTERDAAPSALAVEVEALREENAALRCRLDELGTPR